MLVIALVIIVCDAGKDYIIVTLSVLWNSVWIYMDKS